MRTIEIEVKIFNELPIVTDGDSYYRVEAEIKPRLVK